MSAVCPKCGSSRLRRSRRRTPVDYWRSLFGRYPYRCRKCDARFPLDRQEQERSSTRPLDGVDLRKASERRRNRILRRRREFLLYGFGLAAFLAFLYWTTRERSAPGE